MDHAAGEEELSVEAEFAETVRFLDLYLRQKTDLFLQDYVFDPARQLARKCIELAMLITFLIVGTIVIAAGAVILISTAVPLWGALLIMGAIFFVVAAVLAHELFSRKIVLRTPVAEEVAGRGGT